MTTYKSGPDQILFVHLGVKRSWRQCTLFLVNIWCSVDNDCNFFLLINSEVNSRCSYCCNDRKYHLLIVRQCSVRKYLFFISVHSTSKYFLLTNSWSRDRINIINIQCTDWESFLLIKSCCSEWNYILLSNRRVHQIQFLKLFRSITHEGKFLNLTL